MMLMLAALHNNQPIFLMTLSYQVPSAHHSYKIICLLKESSSDESISTVFTGNGMIVTIKSNKNMVLVSLKLTSHM